MYQTLERINRACDRIAVAHAQGTPLADAAEAVVAEMKGDPRWVKVCRERVAAALAGTPAGRSVRFRPRQAVVLPTSCARFDGPDAIALSTWKGRRRIPVRWTGASPLTAPDCGTLALVERAGQLELSPAEA
jgi:hypothetical protein